MKIERAEERMRRRMCVWYDRMVAADEGSTTSARAAYCTAAAM